MTIKNARKIRGRAVQEKELVKFLDPNHEIDREVQSARFLEAPYK